MTVSTDITSSEHKRIGLLLVFGLALTAANAVLVWIYRFLPLYDYPIWLYTVKVAKGLAAGDTPYVNAFEMAKGPVPNLAFVGLVWIISFLTTIEVAGKIVLTFCVTAFPWIWWWSVRRIAGSVSPWAFLGFPFALNLFFWGRSAYLVALIILLLAFGVFLPKADRLSGRTLAALSVASLALFLLHGVVFAIWSAVLVFLVLRGPRGWRRKIRDLLFVLMPTIVLAMWYAFSVSGASWIETSSFGPGAIIRAIFKPLMPFIKTYGIAPVGPISLYNSVWLVLLAGCVFFHVRKNGLRARPGASWLAASGLVVGCGVLLPLNFLGVVQAGTYFVFPAMFLLCVSAKSNRPFFPIPVLMLTCALCITLYSMMHVGRVDRQMNHFFDDFREACDISQPYAVIGLDWPAGNGVEDVVSASVNPLFGVPFYALLEGEGIAAVFETSVVRLKPEYAWLRTPSRGATRPDYQHSVEQHLAWYLRFPQLVVTGANESSEAIVTSLQHSGYQPVLKREAWTILKRVSNGQ